MEMVGEDIVAFDRDIPTVKNAIATYFGGDGMKFAKYYYDYLAKVFTETKEKIDIVGHVDLAAKHTDFIKFFDDDSKEYKDYALQSIQAVSEKVDIFEINTGGIGRGYRKTAYPAPFILKELNRLGKGVVINSDCHDRSVLNCYFDESVELLKACGFGEVYELTALGFKARPLY